MEEQLVPYYLKEIWQTALEVPYWLHGKCVCPCGCDRFRLKIFADKRENGYPCTAQTEDGFALVIHAVCPDCGKEFVLFDASRHGYECEMYTAISEDRLFPWVCPECGEDTFGTEIYIQPGEDAPDEAFDWIRIDLFGTEHNHIEWLSFETS